MSEHNVIKIGLDADRTQWINLRYFAFAELRTGGDHAGFDLHLTDANMVIPITGGNVSVIANRLDRMARASSHHHQ